MMTELNTPQATALIAKHSDKIMGAVAMHITDEAIKAEMLSALLAVQKNAAKSAQTRAEYPMIIAEANELGDGENYSVDAEPYCEDVGVGLWVDCRVWFDKPCEDLSLDEMQLVAEEHGSLTPEQREFCVSKLEASYQQRGKRVTTATLARLKAMNDVELCTRVLDEAA